MEKTIRCTVCAWRGPWEIAESAPRMRAAAPSSPAMNELQSAYAEQQAAVAMIGGHAPPPCPMCGHHTVSVKLHGYRSVG
jgi:hypothetical protein